MKRAYLTKGVTTKYVSVKDTVISVDTNTYTYLQNLLGADYCYLLLNSVEIIKVLGFSAPNLIIVDRAVAGTDRTHGLSGLSISYQITDIEIQDAVDYKGYSITAINFLSVQNGIIEYKNYNIMAFGGVAIDGDGANWVINDLPENSLCCDDTPPEIPVYLQPYRWTDVGDVRVLDDGTPREYV